jgi:ATP-dependent Lon protease
VEWLPLFPLDLVLLPGGDLPLHIFEPRYRKLIDRCIKEKTCFGVVRTREEGIETIGTRATVVKLLRRYPDGRFDILTRGKDKFRVGQVREHQDGYIEGEVFALKEAAEQADLELEDRIDRYYRKLAAISGDLPGDPPPRGPRWSYRLAERLRLGVDARQALLELQNEGERIRKLEEHLRELVPAMIRKEKVQRLIRGNGRLRGSVRLDNGSHSEGGQS